MKIALAVLLALTPVSAVADEYQRGYSASRTCYKSEYREEYVPGTADNPGYINSMIEAFEGRLFLKEYFCFSIISSSVLVG